MIFIFKKLWIRRIIIFIVGFILTVFLIDYSMIALSNKYQKEICIEDFCIKKPEDWIVGLTKKEKKIYIYGVFPVSNTKISDFYLDSSSNGLILKKDLSKIIIYKYEGKNLFDERLTPQYKINNKIYYMMKTDDSTFVIYPENKFVIYVKNYKFPLKLIESIILNSTTKAQKDKKTKVDSTRNDFTKDILLGLKHYEGKGIPVDYNQAILYFNKAIKYENRIAQFFLGSMYEKGEGVEKDYNKAISFYNKSAKQGYIHALYNLGIMYYYGKGVKQNYTKAASLFQKPVDHGLNDAYSALAELYQYGKGVKKDYKKALLLYKKAIKNNNFIALNNIAIMYFRGQGVEVDKIKACKYWEIASKKGELNALKNIEKNCNDIIWK